jgi:hypothetical protein
MRSRVIAHGLIETSGSVYDRPHGEPRKRPWAIARALKRHRQSLEECGCCGGFHRVAWLGDCRNDAERFTAEVAERAEELGVKVRWA